MAALEKKVAEMSSRQEYRNLWHVELMDSPAEDPLFCCLSCVCGPCVSYMNRKRALYDDMAKYQCCGGYMPCSGRCGESMCPEICLGTEVLCCFTNSVASTRFMLQDEFNIQTSKCDNCIIGTMVCVNQLACICSLVAAVTDVEEIDEASQLLSCVSDLISCVVCPCMQTQAKVEMDKRDGVYGEKPTWDVPPQTQHMSRLEPPISPEATTTSGYGQPLAYPPPPDQVYPPPQGQGYPTYPPYVPPQAPTYPPFPPPQGQTYPPYPPPPGQAYPPYPPPEGQVYPPPPPSPQGQAYPPPPPQGQAYPPYPPPPPQAYPPPNY